MTFLTNSLLTSCVYIYCRDTVLHRLSLELYESSSTGALINLKNVLISKNIAVRTAIGIIGSGPGGSGGHKKNTISLPG